MKQVTKRLTSVVLKLSKFTENIIAVVEKALKSTEIELLF